MGDRLEEGLEGASKELLLELLGTLTKLRKNFPYTLLLYALNPKDLLELLDVMQGTTITFPTKQELLAVIGFAVSQKYGSYEATPKEVLNGLTKKQYNEFCRAMSDTDEED